MGGGSCGCGTYELRSAVSLTLISEKKNILYTNGRHSANDFDKGCTLVDWTSGGSNIGASGSTLIGERTLSEQVACMQKLMDEGFPDLKYSMKINTEGRSGL